MGLRIENLIRCVVGIGGLELERVESLDRAARAGPRREQALMPGACRVYLRFGRFYSFLC